MACSNSILTVVCFALITVVICNSFGINGDGSTNLIALGTVDGKTFFADDTNRNWTTSKTFCSSMGMQLAAITSKAQWEILMAAKNASTFKNDHWTAARDSHESRQFTWDGLDSQPSETFGKWINRYNIIYETCAALDPDIGYEEMHFAPCQTLYKVLCETIS